MAPGGKGKSTGKWIVTLHDINDQSIYKDNGLFLWTKDTSGGWNEMESRLSLGDLKMLGECVPNVINAKNNRLIQENLEWRQAALRKKGYDTQIPTCFTFTEFVNYLVQKGLLPEKPDSNFMAVEIAEDSQVEKPLDQQQHTAPVPQDVQDTSAQNKEMHAVSAPGHSDGFLSPSLLQSQETFTQMVDREIIIDSQEMYNTQDLLYPEEEIKQLRDENDRLLTENQALKNDKKKILESHVILEEKLSEDNSINTENMMAALTGVIDDRMQRYNDSAERCIKREVHSAFNGSAQLANMTDRTTQAANALNTHNHRIGQLTVKVGDMDKTLQTLVKSHDQNQGSLDAILDNSRSVKNENGSSQGNGRMSTPRNDSGNASFLNSGNSNTVSSFNASSSFNAASSSFNAGNNSFNAGNNFSARPKPTRKCSFCLENTHGYETCPQRPMNYKCFRCNGISHRDENCYSKTTACSYCLSVGNRVLGHHVSMHYLTDEKERCQAMKAFGIDHFSHYTRGDQLPPQPNASSTPQMKSRSMSVKRGGPAGHAGPSNTTQVWLSTPPTGNKRNKPS